MSVITFHLRQLALHGPLLHLFHLTHRAALSLDHVQLASEPLIFESQLLIAFILLLIFESKQLHLAAHLRLSGRHHLVTDVVLALSPVNLAVKKLTQSHLMTLCSIRLSMELIARNLSSIKFSKLEILVSCHSMVCHQQPYLFDEIDVIEIHDGARCSQRFTLYLVL